MSWKSEVQTDNSGKWYGNAARFATKAEAEAYVKDLQGRWFAVHATHVVESEDTVNYAWKDGRLCPIDDV